MIQSWRQLKKQSNNKESKGETGLFITKCDKSFLSYNKTSSCL